MNRFLCILPLTAVLAGCVGLLFLQSAFAGEVRSFTNRDGRTIKAELISEEGGQVAIKRSPDGKIFFLPLESLSDDDQSWIKVQSQNIVGVWGGKWDDEWPVFLTISNSDEEGEYKVIYTWHENLDRPMSTMESDAVDKGSYVAAKFLYFKRDEAGIMLYGRFSNPRMANLVRITDESVDLEDVVLEEYGWKEGAIPASEAYEKVTSDEET